MVTLKHLPPILSFSDQCIDLPDKIVFKIKKFKVEGENRFVKVVMCHYNDEMTRGEALVSGEIMDCHDCSLKAQCRDALLKRKVN